MSVGQLQKATEILLYVVLYQARSCYISQEKQVGYELYSFLDHEYSFLDATVSYLQLP